MGIRERVGRFVESVQAWLIAQRRESARFDWMSIVWCVFAGVVPVERVVNGAIDLGGYSVQMLVIAAGIVAVLTRRVAVPSGLWGWFWGAFLMLLPLGGLISAAGDNRLASFMMASMFALYLIVLIAAMTYQARIARARAAMAISFLAVQSLSLLIGLIQAAGFAPFGLAARGGRVNGLATHPNVLAFMAVIAIFVSIALMLSRRGWWLLAGTISVLANLFVIILSQSLSVILALAVAVLVYAVIERRVWYVVVAIATGAVVFVVSVLVTPITFAGIFDLIADRVANVVEGPPGQRGSLQMRIDTYTHAWSHISSSPISGVGADSTYAYSSDGKTVVHNFFLHAWYQGGVFFALFAVGFLVLFVREVYRSYRLRKSGAEISIVMFILVFGATSALFMTNEYWLLILAALSFALAGLDGGGLNASHRNRRSLRSS